jgi:hypothetical protein
VGKAKYTQGLFISKINRADRSGVRSIAGCAIDCSPTCVLPYAVRSTLGSHVHSTMAYAFTRTTFDRRLCVRPQITALKSHGACVEAMEHRAS